MDDVWLQHFFVGCLAFPLSSFAGIFPSQPLLSPSAFCSPCAWAGLRLGQGICSHTCSLWDLKKGAVAGGRGRGIILGRNQQLRGQAWHRCRRARLLRTHFFHPNSLRTPALDCAGIRMLPTPVRCPAVLRVLPPPPIPRGKAQTSYVTKATGVAGA